MCGIMYFVCRIGDREAPKGSRIQDNVLLNIEEWAIYCCRLGVVVAEEDRYGVRVRQFLQTFVEHGKYSKLTP
jgi:hypothetical protein